MRPHTVPGAPESEQRGRGRLVHSLRTTLIASSVVLVVVPGLLFAALAFSSAQDALEKANGSRLAEVTGEAADEFVTAIASQRADVGTWAKNEIMRELVIGDVDKRVARYLGALQQADPAYLELACVDLQGRAVAVSDPHDIDRSFATEQWFSEVAAGREALAGPYRSAREGRSVLEIAAPIVHPDESTRRIGGIVLVYDWQHVGERLARIRDQLAAVGSQVDFLIVDERSIVIGGAWSRELSALPGRSLRDAGWGSVDRSAAAKRTATVEPAVDALVSVSSLATVHPGWRVLGVWPMRDALRAVRRLQRQWVMMLVAILIVSVAVAAAQSARIVRPLRALTEATRDVARARGPKEPVAVRSRDEIGELAAAFNAMVAELERAREELVTATKFRFASEMAAGIAHEVRTPLGVLRTSAQILGRNLPSGDAKSRELVEMMVAEVDRLERVVAGLLELSRPREPVVDVVALDEVLLRAQRFLAGQAAVKSVSLRLDRAPAAAEARCDPEQIYQVVLNLVVNAIRAAPPGGTISLRVLEEPDGRVGFEVTDDGPGIAAAVRDKIFTPFFTTREDGSGLGLAVADRIVRAHHGTIEVDNAPGRGARFRVRLPAAAHEEERD